MTTDVSTMTGSGTHINQIPGQDVVSPHPSGSSQINIGHDERIASAAVGAVLALWAIRGGGRWWMALSGGYLLYRGLSGNCRFNSMVGRNTAEAPHGEKGLSFTETVTVNKPKEELYNYWRKLENLPKFMHHLEQVQQLDSKRSHWQAPIPGGLGNIEWDAEIVQEEANHRIAWRSVAGADVDNSGEVVFRDAPNNRGTEVRTTIMYRPPAGDLGLAVSKLFNSAFGKMVKEDMRRFKSVMETGDTAPSEKSVPGLESGHGSFGQNRTDTSSAVGL